MAEELEARIRRLEDIEAIKKLKATFAYLIDTGDWQGAANLFTEDAILDSGALGHCEGKAEIAKFLRDNLPQIFSFTVHMYHNPVIEVKGGKATGEWYYKVPATHASTNRALWVVGKYEDEYVKVGGEWKFKTWVSKTCFATPYDEGWVKTKAYQ